MRVFEWINMKARTWWPLIVTIAAAMLVGTMAYVISFVAEDRRGLEKQRDQLTELVEAQHEAEETREQRTTEALEAVRQVLAEEIAKHDAQMNRLMARQLEQIDRLLRRPEGTPPDPVTARPQPAPAPAPSPPPSSSSPPATSSPTTAARAPTTPRQKSCDRHPDGKHC